MAQVRLGRFEAEEGDLPAVCLRCGAPSTLVKSRTFSWAPPWVIVLILAGLLPYILVSVILTKRMRVQAPLCEQHRNYWVWRAWFAYGGLAAFAVAGGLWVFLIGALHQPNKHDSSMNHLFALFSCFGMIVFAIWLVALVIVQNSAIRPSEITDRSITLMKVSDRFAQAVHEEYEPQDEDYPDEDLRRAPRRRRADPDRYYDPGRKRPPDRPLRPGADQFDNPGE
jgi:hypothetical protein